MTKVDADRLQDGDIVELRDGSLYHGKLFTVIGRKGQDFIKLNMIERPVIVKTAHISQIEKPDSHKK